MLRRTLSGLAARVLADPIGWAAAALMCVVVCALAGLPWWQSLALIAPAISVFLICRARCGVVREEGE